MHRTFFVCALATFCLGAGKIDAVEALSTQELIAHCAHVEADPEGVDGVFCVRYIQGFIDGAVVTDERVTYNVSDEYEKSSLTRRAVRTRLGNLMGRYGSSYYAEFCLGAPVPLAEVVDKVIAGLTEPEIELARPLARDVVYSVIREHYPCEVDN